MSTARTEGRVLRNHWVARPGWAPERSLVACYLALDGYPDVVRRMQLFQGRLLDLPQLDLVPVEWMHVTVQGIGFADELPAGSLPLLAQALAPALATVPAPVVRLGAPEAGGEGVYLPLVPPDGLAAVRDAVRATARAALGLDALYALPGQDAAPGPYARFEPHASFAYANADVPLGEVMDRVGAVPEAAVDVRVTSLSVIALRQTDRRWWWSERHDVPLGPTVNTT